MMVTRLAMSPFIEVVKALQTPPNEGHKPDNGGFPAAGPGSESLPCLKIFNLLFANSQAALAAQLPVQ